MLKLLASSLGLLAVTLSLVNGSAANDIVNGGFETGNLNGWTVDPFSLGNTQVDVYSGGYCCQGATPPQGTYAAAFGGGGSVTGEIAQEFGTTAGVTYTGSLQYAGVGAAGDGYLEVRVGDATSLAILSDSGQLQPAFNGTWSTYNFSFVATSALSGIDIVSPNGGGTDYLVDNVRVTPEPASWALFGVGAVGLLIASRRRQRRYLNKQ